MKKVKRKRGMPSGCYLVAVDAHGKPLRKSAYTLVKLKLVRHFTLYFTGPKRSAF